MESLMGSSTPLWDTAGKEWAAGDRANYRRGAGSITSHSPGLAWNPSLIQHRTVPRRSRTGAADSSGAEVWFLLSSFPELCSLSRRRRRMTCGPGACVCDWSRTATDPAGPQIMTLEERAANYCARTFGCVIHRAADRTPAGGRAEDRNPDFITSISGKWKLQMSDQL
ncbi:unnamed protein product [Pleuronectes platessa]|uniref:Uncharacterized protein n=1 Tax=Pleuronectes platessa TaxID=8262 RepID=A0A9N7YHG6_PLEPL|nr:unnamed protein product [Pleuronectes platessa]